MRGRKTALRIDLTPEERTELERRVRCTTLPAGAVRRARIILGVASGLHLIEVARRVGITEKHVRKWTLRFNENRLEGLKDRPGLVLQLRFAEFVRSATVMTPTEVTDDGFSFA